jgi:hypothetical protein
MQRAIIRTTVLAIALMAIASFAAADVPQLINYQGRLTDESGNPVPDANYQITFTIYDDSTAGTSNWTETQSVAVTGGLFHVLLGSVSALTDGHFVSSERWLGIKVGADPELVPRTRLVTVPYAFRVSTVDSASGGTIHGDLQVTGRINQARFGTNWSFSDSCRVAVDMDGNNVDNGEVHFGNAGFDNQWVDMWFAYSNGALIGNYIKYDGSTTTYGHFRLTSSGVIVYSGPNAANSAGHAYWNESDYDVEICEDNGGNGFCEWWYLDQRHE